MKLSSWRKRRVFFVIETIPDLIHNNGILEWPIDMIFYKTMNHVQEYLKGETSLNIRKRLFTVDCQ